MKLKVFAALTMLLTSVSAISVPSSPNIDDFGKKESFVIKGKVGPDFGKTFETAVTGYINNDAVNIDIDENGEFCRSISMQGPLQEMYMYIDNTVTVPVIAGDTLIATYFDKKLTLSSPDPDYDRNLKFAKLRHDMMRQRRSRINRASFGDLSNDSTKNALIDSINSYITDYNKLITDFEKENGTLSQRDYFINDAYYGVMFFIIRSGLLENVSAAPLESTSKKAYRKVKGADMIYPAAREFGVDYIRALSSEMRNKIKNDEPGLYRAIKIGRALAPDPFMADLVSAEQLRVSTLFDSYSEIEKSSVPSLRDIETDWIKEDISGLLEVFKQTAAGSALPQLTLTGMDGKPVSLDKYKGKVVLLDLWSVGCGPCMMEFSKMEEFKKLYADHKDDLQIITVCCGEPSDKSWKRVIDKYKLDDLNTKLVPDKSAEIYSNIGWPTYVLVDREGKIFEWNTVRPSIIMQMKQHNATTPIDKALSEK